MLLAGRGYYRYPFPVNATLLHWGDGSLHGDTLLRQVVSLSDLLFVHQITSGLSPAEHLCCGKW